MSLSIYVSTHKEGFVPSVAPFKPIQVGAAGSASDLGYLKDSSGDNISHKNKNYCELTAQYWVWKNAVKTDFVGFCHYRRYFSLSGRLQHTQYEEESSLNNFFLEDRTEDLIRAVQEYDFLLLKPFSYYHSVANTLTSIVQADDIAILERVIDRMYPEYREAFVKFMYHNNRISSCNMFITRWELFERYSEWLFSILEKAEEEIKISPYVTPARVFGFLGEALLNIFLLHHELKTRKTPLLAFRDDVKNDSDFVFILKEARRFLSFQLNRPPSQYKLTSH